MSKLNENRKINLGGMRIFGLQSYNAIEFYRNNVYKETAEYIGNRLKKSIISMDLLENISLKI